MEWSLKNSAREVRDGLGMLVEQAALSFNFWHGISPKTDSVLSLIRETNG